MPRRWYLLPCRTFQPVVVTTQSLPSGTQGTAYSFQYSANGGTTPYTWTLVSETGANTWSLSSGGLLTGTPSNAETDVITVKVTDAVGGTATSAPLSLTVAASGGSYVFNFYVAPPPIGNDANNGQFPTQGAGVNGPWTHGSLLSAITGNPTNQQKLNNAAMAGKVVGMVGDQGSLTLAQLGLSYPVRTGSGNVFDLPAGTAGSPTILASCNSTGQYVRGLAVLDCGATGSEYSSMNIIGRFTLTAGATDAQYVTIDGIEVKNGMNGGIVMGISAPSGNCPGWTVKNCYVHHIYNSSQQFTATGCSLSNGSGASGNQLVIGAVTSGTVHYGPNGGQDQLLTAPFPGVFINGFVSGTPGGAGTYTCSGSGLVPGPNNLTGSAFAGSNTAGISFHGASAGLIQNNFIENIIDLNTAASSSPNNQRAVGIKTWTSINTVTQFNTIYATVATGYPTGGILHKNVPQWNNTLANNYIHLANAVPDTAVDVMCLAMDGESSTTVTVPNGHFGTVNNNILIANPNGSWALPTEIGGGNTQALLINFYNNTMIGVGSPGHGGWFRGGPTTGQNTINYHDNIIDRATPQAGGNGGDFRTQLGNINHIDFDLWPPNYLINLTPNTSLSGGTLYSAIPAQNGGISGAMAALTGATGLENCGGAGPQIGVPVYANASGTKLKAADYQLATGSPGQGKGTGGSDIGAWGGGVTQIGCNFRDPSG